MALNWLQPYDMLAPINPYAALFFGIVISIIVGVIVWYDTKQKKSALVALVAGCFTSLLGVCSLVVIGFY